MHNNQTCHSSVDSTPHYEGCWMRFDFGRGKFVGKKSNKTFITTKTFEAIYFCVISIQASRISHLRKSGPSRDGGIHTLAMYKFDIEPSPKRGEQPSSEKALQSYSLLFKLTLIYMCVSIYIYIYFLSIYHLR